MFWTTEQLKEMKLLRYPWTHRAWKYTSAGV